MRTIDSDSDDEEENLRRPRGPDRKWIRERTGKGAFVNIFKDLELTDAEDFRRFMRMDVPHFQELLSLISSDLQKTETRMRKPITPKERLALTLRFLATGETFRSLEFQFRISRKAISYIVDKVVDAIYRQMGQEHLSTPASKERWQNHEEVFRERCNSLIVLVPLMGNMSEYKG